MRQKHHLILITLAQVRAAQFPYLCTCYTGPDVCEIKVSTTSGNPGNTRNCLLEFEIPSGNTGNLLEFNCSYWKFLYNRSMMIDDLQE